MSFKVGMPESGSTLGNTRRLFVNELAGMRSTMSANHVDQNNDDQTAIGKHTFCKFINVAAGITSATELALYNKANSAGQRFFIRQPNTGTEIQMSGVDPIVKENKGCVFLPGGLLLQWGKGLLKKNLATSNVHYAKQGADGFVLLRLISLQVREADFTYGFTNIFVPVNDGFSLSVATTKSEDFIFTYMAIGTLA